MTTDDNEAPPVLPPSRVKQYRRTIRQLTHLLRLTRDYNTHLRITLQHERDVSSTAIAEFAMRTEAAEADYDRAVVEMLDARGALTAERKKVDLLREMLMMYHDADDCDGGCIVAHILSQTAPEEEKQ